jgi:Predicted ATPase involved in replication control, Cdc46/Mcm family
MLRIFAPKAVYTSGKGSSAAGLTAAAVKDELSEGRWTLEAGTLVLADGGLAAIDELDKMNREDSGAMHQAMEQQSISISKAGINATLMSRCAVLAAANPKYGRFEEDEPFTSQTDLPITLLSRFDLIFMIVDRPGKMDNEMADYILKVHKSGETIASGRSVEKVQIFPTFERDFLKKYIVYARKNSFPIMSPKAEEKIKKFYVEKRATSVKLGSVTITPRQLEALIRLSEASARVRLSDRVEVVDVERATRLMEAFLNQATVINGIQDIDVIMSGYSSKDRKGAFSILEIIKQLQDASTGRRASLREIREEAKKHGIEERQVDRELKILNDKGEVIEVVTGFYRALEK